MTAGFPYGPGESFLLPELRELVRQGHEVTIVPLRMGGAVLTAGAARLLDRVGGVGLVSASALGAMGRALRRAPGTVGLAIPTALAARTLRGRVTNLALLPTACWVADLAARLRADHLHAYWAAGPASVAMLASQLGGTPWSFTAHRWDIWENNLLVRKLRRASFIRLIAADGRRLLAEVLERERLPSGERERLLRRTRVIHLGVDLPTEAAPEAGGATIICPASLLPVKGHQYLLEAFGTLVQRHPSARLLLAGEGPLRSALARQAAAAGLADRVELLGHLPHDRLLALYAHGAVRCAALASVTLAPGQHEGIPVGLIEAMGHGIPVVATASGGIPELLGRGGGILVPERDPAALADALERVLRDGEWRAMAAAARETVREAFDARRSAAALAELMTRGMTA